jgi:hypothetical protein
MTQPGEHPLLPVHLTLTTIPERLRDPYFRKVLLRLVSFRTRKIWLQIPWVYKRTGETYVIPAWLEQWHNDPTHPVTIRRVEDRGPLTKLWGIWDFVPYDEAVLYLDDDLIYRDFLVRELYEAWQKTPRVLWCFKVYQDPNWIQAGWNFYLPEGYAGCITSCETLALLHTLQSPQACFAIDDHWLGWAFHQLHIPVRPMNLHYPWYHVLELEEHPRWFELKNGTNRTILQASCRDALLQTFTGNKKPVKGLIEEP